jgi:dihydroneopterin aldolase/2-amino-4-hydroxy-6-hydroxymethyldihydropteridine diphosphokinase/dihydropteroate synthase
MLDEIIIRELTVNATVGPDRWDKRRAQPIRVTTTLYTSITAAGRSDKLDDTIDYGPMCKGITNLVDGGEFDDLHTLAQCVAAYSLTQSAPAAQIVKVQAEALNQFLSAESLGVVVWKANVGWEAKAGHDKGLINNLTANVIIGVNPLERISKQSVDINLIFRSPKWSDVDWHDIYNRLTKVSHVHYTQVRVRLKVLLGHLPIFVSHTGSIRHESRSGSLLFRWRRRSNSSL